MEYAIRMHHIRKQDERNEINLLKKENGNMQATFHM